MDAQGEALLAGVLAHPDDDAPRLVMADWLEENGDLERAEFIRCQLAPAVKPRHREAFIERCSCRACWPLNRGRALLRSHGALWLGPAAQMCGCRPGRDDAPWRALLHSVGRGPDLILTYKRGFVGRARLPADDWVRHHAALLALHPVRHVTLTSPLRFGIIGGRPGVAVFDGPAGSRMPPAEFIPADRDAPEEWLGDENGPPWIVSRLWPGISFEHPPP